MERTLKIFLSCSFGAAIGAIVALGVNHYFWWLGLIVGGLTGYLSYEFKKVVEATAEGYKRAAGWKLSREHLKTRGLLALEIALYILTVYPIILCFMISSGAKFKEALSLGSIALVISTLCICLASLFISDEKEINKMREICRTLNFFTVYFYWLPRGIFLTITKIIPKMILLLARFAKTVFLLIHSDIRLLCGMDAAIGAGIGYFTGSVIVGTFAGGILGAIQYEIVSKRILHIPKTTWYLIDIRPSVHLTALFF